jgi:hypothetical protein
VLLEVLNGGGSELEGSELVATLLEAGDDLTNETCGGRVSEGTAGRGSATETYRAERRRAWQKKTASVRHGKEEEND